MIKTQLKIYKILTDLNWIYWRPKAPKKFFTGKRSMMVMSHPNLLVYKELHILVLLIP